MEEKTSWASIIRTIAKVLLFINIVAGIGTFAYLAEYSYTLDDYAWIALVAAAGFALFNFPLMMGFAQIVEAAEKKLK